MTMNIDTLSWIANALAVIGWTVNIKYRNQAMMIFTAATVIHLVYFWNTRQMPFVYRFVFYLGINAVTLWQIARDKRAQQRQAALQPGVIGDES
jgi:hypothetical protein